DQRSRQDHRAEHTTSNLLCKNALLDEAHSIFAGLIRVEENAQHADGYQTNRNLIIGPSAVANSMPGLEILANDVKCSHGATTGNIDGEQLFYLRSRGIPSPIAKQLLMLGFFEEVLSGIPPQLADSIRKLLQDKLESSTH
ncbi:MAG: SufD family Fe-S cluster assembly protein, partial [Opitutales bacterium]